LRVVSVSLEYQEPGQQADDPYDDGRADRDQNGIPDEGLREK
jgi:hypothetical protein